MWIGLTVSKSQWLLLLPCQQDLSGTSGFESIQAPSWLPWASTALCPWWPGLLLQGQRWQSPWGSTSVLAKVTFPWAMPSPWLWPGDSSHGDFDLKILSLFLLNSSFFFFLSCPNSNVVFFIPTPCFLPFISHRHFLSNSLLVSALKSHSLWSQFIF